MERCVRGRFAPSPSGRMHLGNLFAALLAWLGVRAVGGTMVLRMEDLDPERCRPVYGMQLADDLRWLGLDWDEGFQVEGPHRPYLQSERAACYTGAFGRLEGEGLVYPCYCTRAERLAAGAPHRSDGQAVYSGRCRSLPDGARTARAGRRPAWRLRVPEREIAFRDGCLGIYREELSRDCGDFIIRRSDGVYAYQLAVVVDDGTMEITQVVRGRDLLESTPRQIYLYEQLGLTAPEFYHVPLLLAPDGRRLSKRDGDLNMEELRRRYTPEELLGWLGHLAGLLERPRPVSAGELIARFDWSRVRREDVRVEDAP